MAGPQRPKAGDIVNGEPYYPNVTDFFKNLFGFLGANQNQPATPETPTAPTTQPSGDSAAKRQVLAAKYGQAKVDSLSDAEVDTLWLQEVNSGGGNLPSSVQSDQYWIDILQDPKSSELEKQVASINLGLTNKTTGGRNLTAAELQLQNLQVQQAQSSLEEAQYQKGRRSFKEFADFLAQQISLGQLKRQEADSIWQREVDREKMRLEAPQNAASVIKTLGGGAVPSTPQRLPGFSGQTTAPEPFQPYVNAMMPQLPNDQQLGQQVQQNLPYLSQLAQQAAAMSPQYSGGAASQGGQ